MAAGAAAEAQADFAGGQVEVVMDDDEVGRGDVELSASKR